MKNRFVQSLLPQPSASRGFTAARIVVAVLGAVMACWAFLPYLLHRIANIGVWTPLAVGIGAVCWGWKPPALKTSKGWRRKMMIAFLVLLACVAVVAVVFSAMMIGAAVNRPASEDATLIVLGAKVNGRTPSLMLRGRLEVAFDYLQAHPNAVCIVSGGQGSDEACSEAEAMAEYLIAKGIPAERILLEDRSTSTFENIQYSLEIIREKGLSENLAIATQEFHQYRAATLARRAGAQSVGAVTCASPLHLLLCYWVRECAAICRLLILKY